MTQPCPKPFTPPNTLLECLQLLASLNTQNPNVKSKVVDKLKSDLQKYCDPDHLNKFAKTDSEHLSLTIVYSYTVLTSITGLNVFDKYAKLDDSEECAQEIVRALAECLPKVFSALYFLYFQTFNISNVTGSGQWSGQQLTGSGHNDLYNWLTGSESTDQFMVRKFDKIFQNNRGSDLVPSLQKLIGHDTAMDLQKALLGMLFICPWPDHLTGHALCFLHTFCDKVTQAQQSEDLKSGLTGLHLERLTALKLECISLKTSLQPFIGQFAILSAVCWQNVNLYDELISSNQFPMYLDWLWGHLKHIIVALSRMLSDSTKWNSDELEKAETAGPFKYGFVFKSWDGKSPKAQLQTHIPALIYALLRLLEPKTLKECLQLCAKLHSLDNLKKSVITRLKDMVQPYCADSYLGYFLNPRTGSDSRYLTTAFHCADHLLKDIMHSSSNGQYDGLESLEDPLKGCETDLAEWCAGALAGCLPKAFSALYFLYFHTCSIPGVTGSGQWSADKLQGQQSRPGQWLLDKIPEPDLSGLIKRGFDSESGMFKTDTSGQTLGDTVKTFIGHDSAEALQKALLGMFFICPWSDHLTGHALCFLHTFCDRVQDAQTENALKSEFNVVSWHAFQHACRNLRPCLALFIGQSAILSAVCWQNVNLYDELISSNQFPMYLDWLWGHLKHIIVALSRMLSDSTKWRQGNLNNASSAGPFKYGFVFKSWDGKSPKAQLQTHIPALIYALLRLLEPKTLKECLQLCAKLHSLDNLKKSVITRLKDMVQPYCADSYLGYFLNPRTGSDSGYLTTAFQHCDALLARILKGDPYGPYHGLAQCDPEKIVKALAGCLPKAFTALYFLYFNTCSIPGVTGSGQWSGKYVKGHGSRRQYLSKWLRDRAGRASGLMARGFEYHELQPSQGFSLATSLSQLVSHHTPMALQHALVGMLFRGPWHHYKLGHALCFLYTLCSKVTQNDTLKSGFQTQIHGLNWPKFQSVCSKLKSKLTPFIKGDQTKIQAVCWQNANLYYSVWHNDKLESYIMWLSPNIYCIIASLESMLKDSSEWTILYLQSAISAGPFKYGFIFSKSWSGTSPESQLQTHIPDLISSLQALSNWLDPLYNAVYNGTQVGFTHTEMGLYSAGMGLGYGIGLGLSAVSSGLKILDKVLQTQTKEGEEEEEDEEETEQDESTESSEETQAEEAEENGQKESGQPNVNNQEENDNEGGSETPPVTPTVPSPPKPKPPKLKPPVLPCRILRKSLAPRLISAQAPWLGASWPAWASLHWAP